MGIKEEGCVCIFQPKFIYSKFWSLFFEEVCPCDVIPILCAGNMGLLCSGFYPMTPIYCILLEYIGHHSFLGKWLFYLLTDEDKLFLLGVSLD